MGLSLEVGILADLVKNDEEGAAHYRKVFERLNRYLATQGLAPHREPEQGKVWSTSMYGYAGLHYLRRIAAHLDYNGKLPPPGERGAANDPVLERYFKDFESRLIIAQPRERRFDHLIIHSDAEGYYLPQDFAAVLFPGPDYAIAGGMIGSSHRLLAECQRLAKALEVPADLDPEGEELWQATEHQGAARSGWQRYGIESYTCVRLLLAAERSIETGAAVVFC